MEYSDVSHLSQLCVSSWATSSDKLLTAYRDYREKGISPTKGKLLLAGLIHTTKTVAYAALSLVGLIFYGLSRGRYQNLFWSYTRLHVAMALASFAATSDVSATLGKIALAERRAINQELLNKAPNPLYLNERRSLSRIELENIYRLRHLPPPSTLKSMHEEPEQASAPITPEEAASVTALRQGQVTAAQVFERYLQPLNLPNVDILDVLSKPDPHPALITACLDVLFADRALTWIQGQKERAHAVVTAIYQLPKSMQPNWTLRLLELSFASGHLEALKWDLRDLLRTPIDEPLTKAWKSSSYPVQLSSMSPLFHRIISDQLSLVETQTGKQSQIRVLRCPKLAHAIATFAAQPQVILETPRECEAIMKGFISYQAVGSDAIMAQRARIVEFHDLAIKYDLKNLREECANLL